MVSCQLRNAALALRAEFTLVMPGLEPGIHLLQESWIAGSFYAKTRFALLPGNDDPVRH
jgi:hypothetical protein